MRTLTQAGLMTAFLAAATAAGAQPPFSIVTGFKAQQTVTPNTLLLASDGNFYGTTSFGGTFDKGTLFRVSPGGIVTVLHDFTGGNEGAWPLNLIQASDGNLYGPSYEGGDGCGTIFRATLSGTVTTLHTFPISSAGYPDGCGPNSLVEAFDGNLYGTAGNGSAGGGTLFRMSLGGSFTVLFDVLQYGLYGTGGLIQASNGRLYGLAEMSGSSRAAVFSITLDGIPSLSVLTSFTNSFYGGDFVQATNRYFFVAVHNTIYRMTTDGRSTIVHELTGMNGEGSFPSGMVVASDGNVYGTTAYGGDGLDFDGHGTVFKITPDSTVSTIYTFTGGSDGAHPSGRLAIGPDGQLYGTTNDGVNHGTIFRLTLDGHLTTLARAFAGGLTGAHPMAELVEGSDGALYGTTSDGGTDNLGAVFQLATDGTTRWLHYFKGGDGASPNAALLQAPDGSFYSTTAERGTSGLGAVFRLQTDGTFALLHSFTGNDGAHPYSPLVRSADGNFYGTTRDGGTFNFGTVFRMTPAGDLTTLYSFTGVADGGHPIAALTLATDGNLYGTSPEAGQFNAGTAFRLTPAGSFTLLHAFSGTDGTGRDGTSPRARLLQASDGNFYGTTFAGGSFNKGTVFKMSPGGGVSLVHSLAGSPEGASPVAGLIQVPDGSFFGTTMSGGISSFGTLFRIAPTGAFTTLHAFWDSNYGGTQEGSHPSASLLLTRAGNLFGTTSTGYWYGGGSVFRLETLPGAARVRSALTAAGTVRLTWTSPRAESFIIRRHTIGATDDVVLASGLSTTSFEDTTAAVAPGRAYAYTVTAINTYGAVDLAEVAVHAPSARGDDYDGDGTTDIAVFGPTSGMWFVINSSNRNGVGTLFGNGSDLPVPGDYDGDGKTDLAVFRPSDGTWYIGMSRTNSSAAIPYGNSSDIPVPADYDGDGRTDLAVFRPSNGTWYIWQSSTNSLLTVVLGAAGDRPVMADYDGDGLTDVATFRPAMGTWTIRLSSTGEIVNASFGSAADTPIPGDYDGDGKADIAVFRSRPGYWEIWQSSTRTLKEIYYFLAGAIPVVGDYDGDGQTDQTDFTYGQWNALLSSGGQIYQIWGGPADIPLPKHP